jgi:photosystem II stability/assembly factor-like uncharacterized protein
MTQMFPTLRATLPALALVLLLAANDAVAQTSWQQTGGPTISKTVCLKRLPDGRIFAATERGGIFVSTDAGVAWSYHSLGGEPLLSLYLGQGGTMFAGTQASLWISSDFGANWEKASLGSAQTAAGITAFANGTIVVGGLAGVTMSTDRGATWTEFNTGLSNVVVTSLVADANENLYIGLSYGGIWKSTDKGAHWAKIDLQTENSTIRNITITADGKIYAAATGMGIIRSTDDGASWTLLANGMDRLETEACHVTSNGVLFAGTNSGRLYRSTNDGVDWVNVHTNEHAEPVLSLIDDPAGVLLCGTAWIGMLRSTDAGQTWAASNAGLINTDAASVVVLPNGKVMSIASSYYDVVRTDNDGTSWVSASGGKNLGARQLAVSLNGYVYAATPRGVMHSTDEGLTWDVDTINLTKRSIRTIASSPVGHLFAGAQGGGLFRSTNAGYSWEDKSSTLGKSDVLCFAFAGGGVMFVGTERDGFYRSTDNGTNFTPLNSGLTRVLISSLAYDPVYGMYAGSYGEIYHTSNQGQQWKRVSYNLFSGTINSVVLNSRGIPTIGMELRGVWYLNIFQNTWVEWNGGMFNPTVLSLVAHPGGVLYAGTAGNGVFKSLSIPAGIEDSPSDALTIALEQNAPNPVHVSRSDRATFRFTLPAPGSTPYALELYDALGRRLGIIATGTSSGVNTVTASLGDLAPGQYVYRVHAGRFSASKMLTVVR